MFQGNGAILWPCLLFQGFGFSLYACGLSTEIWKDFYKGGYAHYQLQARDL